MAQKRILLGITGGIAAYKSAELTRLLVKAGHHVEVVMSEAATRFVTPATFQALSGNAVYTDIWDPRPDNAMAHIEMSRRADVFLIVPATADCIFKLAHGACDDLISTMAAARTCPLVVVPAMNRQMWEAPPTQRNAAQLQADGVSLLGPTLIVHGTEEQKDHYLPKLVEPEIRCALSITEPDAGSDAQAIKTQARRDGMRTMREDGVRKVLAGLTTIEEVVSVTVGDPL